jgi:FG-GAP-like repeat
MQEAARGGLGNETAPAPGSARMRRAYGALCVVVLAAGCGKPGPSPTASSAPAPGQPTSAQQIAQLMDTIRVESAETNPFFGDAELKRLEKRLDKLPENGPAESRFRLHWSIAMHQLRLAQTQAAIDQFERAASLLESGAIELPEKESARFLFERAVANLRLAENQNCVFCRNSESCLFPLRGGGVHTDQAAARQAMALMTALLERHPEHLAGRWLLNILAMTVGEYPEKVPEQWLIPPERFASEEDFPRFAEVAKDLGISPVDTSGGTVIDDFDGDGYLDIVCSNWDPRAPGMHYFRNNADGTFEERTDQAGLSQTVGGLNLLHADFDNDGDLDLLIPRGAWLGKEGKHPLSLLANDGRGTFVDVTFDVGLGGEAFPTHSADFADFDNDGDLDLYVGHESDFPSSLWENDGRGRFTNVAERAGVLNNRFAKGVAWGDYNNDRFPDLYVSNLRGSNRLYRNNGNGTFTDVAPELKVTDPQSSFVTWFWDYNNDGALDIFVGAPLVHIDEITKGYLGLPFSAETQRLYEGDNKGAFKDVTAERNLARVSSSMGGNFGDLDADGFPDFYLGTGYPEYEALMPNLMFHNRAGERSSMCRPLEGLAICRRGMA